MCQLSHNYFKDYKALLSWTSICLFDVFTWRKWMGKPMSTLLMFSSEDIHVRSVFFSRKSLSIATPSSVPRSHSSVKSCTSLSPVVFSVMTLILSELRILHIVEVDSKILPLKMSFPNILLIKVDLPALVSPVIRATIYLFMDVLHILKWLTCIWFTK